MIKFDARQTVVLFSHNFTTHPPKIILQNFEYSKNKSISEKGTNNLIRGIILIQGLAVILSKVLVVILKHNQVINREEVLLYIKMK